MTTRGVNAERCDGVDNVWWHPGGPWWPGYDGQDGAIIDDLRPEDWKLQALLRLLDRYPLRVPFKGGFRQFTSKFIWITCPRPPQECFLEAGEDIEQLLRRIDVVKEFK